jgi:hypothetical protein
MNRISRSRLAAMVTVSALLLGCTHLWAAGVEIVTAGKAAATIVLPAETEWDRYVNATPEQIEAFARGRFPNASAEQLSEVIARLPKERAKEAKRAGDDEVLAATELSEFIEKIAGEGAGEGVSPQE